MRHFILSAILFITALHYNAAGQPLTWVKSPTLVKMSDTVWNVDFKISKVTENMESLFTQ